MTTFFFRTWDLLNVPPGLTHDEASNGHDASAILAGQHAIYFPVGYGHEPLYNYSVAAVTYFLGEGIYTLRFTSVLWSLLTWSLTVALSRRWWGRSASVLTAAIITLSFWAQMMGRVGLRAPVLPALFTASVLFFDRAVHNHRRDTMYYVLSGLFLGSSFYTYMASRGLPLIFVAFLASQFILNRDIFKTIWRGTNLVLGTALLTGSPLFVFLAIHPELEQRVAQLGGAITAFFKGNWQPLVKNIMDSLPLLLWRADPRWLYNIGGRAALEPLFAGLFCSGCIATLLQISKRRHLFLLLWLGCGLAPALLTSVEYNTLHAIAAMPAVFLLVSYGLYVLLTIALKTMTSKSQRIFIFIVLICAFIATGLESMQAYFIRWGLNRDVRVAYHHHVVSLGRELRSSAETSPVVMTSLYPGQVHDPYTMDITLKDKNLPLRWVDGRSAVFLPTMQSRLYIEEQTKLSPSLWALIKPDVQPFQDLIFKPDDIPARITSYIWESNTTWNRTVAAFEDDFYAYEGKLNVLQNAVHLAAPVNYGDIIILNCYHMTPTAVAPGEHLTLLTAWSVLSAYADELAIFVHLIDQDGNIIAQQDSLAAPSWQWEKGDRFIHQHDLILPSDMASGETMIAVGIYRRDDFTRLPVLNQSVDLTRIFIHLDVNEQ